MEHSLPLDRRNYNNIHCVELQMAESIIEPSNFTGTPTRKMDSKKKQWQKTLTHPAFFNQAGEEIK